MLSKGSRLLYRTAATASLFLLVMLVIVPCAVLFFFAVNPLSISSSPHLRLFHIAPIYWAVWALVSVWAALDSSKLLRTLGMPVDPLGSYGVWGLLLGALNVGASMLVVTLRLSQ
jgi:hypothetical protein